MISKLLIIKDYERVLIPPYEGSNPSTPASFIESEFLRARQGLDVSRTVPASVTIQHRFAGP